MKAYSKTGDPVISVDTKKKELVGNFRNAGRTWQPRGEPVAVQVHDFPHLGHGKAVPYGAYDIARNRAVVNVGVSHDTAEFAIESIRRWWRLDGRRLYRDARRLLICADSGGSNGHKLRVWKIGLQTLADELAMPITVCHGATKTRTGLRVKAVLDTRTYHKGLIVEEAAMRDVQLRRHTLHPDWNYTVESLSA